MVAEWIFTMNERSHPWAQNLVELARDLIFFCRDGVISYANAGAVRAFGRESADRLIGRMFVDLVHPDDQMMVTESLQPLIDALAPMPLRLSTGGEMPLDVEIEVVPHRPMTGDRTDAVQVTLVARDISWRLNAEDAIARTHEDYQRTIETRTRELAREIASRQQVEENLRFAAQALDATNEGVLLTDPSFVVTSTNRAYSRIAGQASEDVIGFKPEFLGVMARDRDLFGHMQRDIQEKSQWEGELWTSRAGGERCALHLSITAIRDSEHAIERYAILVADITRRKEDEERIHYQANYDALTGLPNRTLLRDRLEQSMMLARRRSAKVVLMLVDLDGFKLVNDTLGHDTGDKLLCEAARRLIDCVRGSDTVARLGGDEFAVVLSDFADERHAPVVAQRIIDAVSKPFALGGEEAFVSASVGITTFPDDAENVLDLLRNADSAMYRAKDKGKSNFQYFTADMNGEVKERLFLKTGLSMALERGELMLHYQPKMGLRENWITGVEALMRWRHPDLGMISPGRFIPVLEESGLVMDAGVWAMREACRQFVHWQAQGLPAIPVAVNLSARQLRDDALVGLVDSVLAEAGVGPDALQIEITESMLMSEHAQVIRVLGALHDRGLTIAMDDFGTGYSSLSYLKRFPIDVIKIDRSFVADIATDQDDAEIIRTIITMGQSLRRRVVAEGVEDGEQLRILKEYQCHEIQGFYFSPPLPAERIAGYVRGLQPPFKPDT